MKKLSEGKYLTKSKVGFQEALEDFKNTHFDLVSAKHYPLHSDNVKGPDTFPAIVVFNIRPDFACRQISETIISPSDFLE